MRKRPSVIRRGCPLALLLTLAVALWPGVATAGVPIPVVTGPIPANVPPGDPSHDYPQLATSLDLARPLDLASLGYVEEEYFFSGTANVYSTPTLATGTIVSSGHPYKSRIIVRRPTSPAQFNGTVLVEWVNVTSGYNNDTLFRGSQDHLVRAGYAYVGVSAQRVGVQVPPAGLTAWSPTRYGSLDVTDNGTITDDSLSYDIFSQAAQAIRTPRGVDMLAGLPVRRIIAIGASQSEGRLVTYHNSIHPLANVFDGYVLVLGLGGQLRTDLGVKVFKVNTETDLLFLGEVAARQPDSDHLRTWEVAGASHVAFSDHAGRVGLVARDSLPPYTPWICTIQRAEPRGQVPGAERGVRSHLPMDHPGHAAAHRAARRRPVRGPAGRAESHESGPGHRRHPALPAGRADRRGEWHQLRSGPLPPLRVPYAPRCGDVGAALPEPPRIRVGRERRQQRQRQSRLHSK
jgi:hypothetical protein